MLLLVNIIFIFLGKVADVVLAAYYSNQVALRMMKIGTSNSAVTDAIRRVCESYKVNPVEGVLSHRMKRDIVDSFDVIINKTTIDQKVDQRDFDFGDVFGMDVIVSTGEGKPKEVIYFFNS
jgi:uncharacterized membrane protein YjjP (DUF1212 family)